MSLRREFRNFADATSRQLVECQEMVKTIAESDLKTPPQSDTKLDRNTKNTCCDKLDLTLSTKPMGTVPSVAASRSVTAQNSSTAMDGSADTAATTDAKAVTAIAADGGAWMATTAAGATGTANKSRKSAPSQSSTELPDDSPLFFFGKQSFLSNFYDSPAEAHERRFKTAEHAYQYLCATLAGQPSLAEKIAKAEAPGEAKTPGCFCECTSQHADPHGQASQKQQWKQLC